MKKTFISFILIIIGLNVFSQLKTKHGIVIGRGTTVIDSAEIVNDTLGFYSEGSLWSFGYMGKTVSVNFDNTITVGALYGDYTTVQVAIDSASSGDVIWVLPGIYTGNITINKNLTLYLHPNAIIDYVTNNAGYTVNIGSGDTVRIIGGTIRRSSTTQGGCIQNKGVLYCSADLDHRPVGTTYIINNEVSGELYLTNNQVINTSYHNVNRAYLDGTVYIDTKIASFCWFVDSGASVYIRADKMVIDSTMSSSSYVKKGSKLNMDVREMRLSLYDGVEVEGYMAQVVYDSSTFTFTGNYNFVTGTGTNTKVVIHDAYCNEGMPRVDVSNGADTSYITLTNCNLKWIYPDRMPDGITGTPTGRHYFENASDTSYCIFRIDNSYLQWSEPVALGDTSRELGNIFYWNGGEFYMNNSTIVDYNDDYSGYGNISQLETSQKIRIYNTSFAFYGHQGGPMFSMLDRTAGSQYWDCEFINCHFSRRESDYEGAFFSFSFQDRTLNDSDHIVFYNCTFEDDSSTYLTSPVFALANGGGGAMTFDDFLAVLEQNYTLQYSPAIRTSDIKMVGPGHFSATKEYFGYRVNMNEWASYETLAPEDTISMVITFKEKNGAADNGEVPRRNWSDIDLKLMIREANLTAAPYYFRYYDMRAVALNPGDGTESEMDTTLVDNQDGGGFFHPGISWTFGTGSATVQIINRDATYGLTIDAWIRQSLNVESITFE